MNWRDVPIPDLMADLPRDRRGYPIPYIVARDRADEPLFTINDSEVTRKQAAECRCGICGGVIEPEGFYFVGGPASAFHPQGGFYIDGPTHEECSAYALMVCPYLAAPRYTGRIDAAPAMKNGVDFAVLVDSTMLPERPVCFVPIGGDMACAPGDRRSPSSRFFDYDVWQFGELIEDEEQGIALIREGLAAVATQTPQAPRTIPVQPGASR